MLAILHMHTSYDTGILLTMHGILPGLEQLVGYYITYISESKEEYALSIISHSLAYIDSDHLVNILVLSMGRDIQC